MAAAMILQSVGSAIQAVGQIRQGNAANAAAEYNAKVAEQNAAQARASANEEARRFRIGSRKELGSARAQVGASGVQLEGSPLDVIQENARNQELDALTMEHGGEIKGRSFENEANLERFRGRNAKIAGYMGAASTTLNAIGGK